MAGQQARTDARPQRIACSQQALATRKVALLHEVTRKHQDRGRAHSDASRISATSRTRIAGPAALCSMFLQLGQATAISVAPVAANSS